MDARAKNQLQAVLQGLVSSQPNDPIKYMCTTLQNLVSSPLTSRVEAAMKKVMECVGEDKTPQQDEDNIFRAFELLGEGDSDLVPVVFTGISLNHYHSFMDQLIEQLDVAECTTVKRYLIKQDSLIVSYPEFKCKVKFFLLFMRYLAVCKVIFRHIDTEGKGRVSSDVMDKLLSNLSDAVTNQQQAPQRIAVQLMAAEVKDTKMSQKKDHDTISYEEFQQKAIELFTMSSSI